MRRIKQRRFGLSVTSTVIFITCCIFIVLCITKYHDIKARQAYLKAEQEALLAEQQALLDKKQELEAQNIRGTDAAYIESIARSQLDMVFPGEIIFRATGE